MFEACDEETVGVEEKGVGVKPLIPLSPFSHSVIEEKRFMSFTFVRREGEGGRRNIRHKHAYVPPLSPPFLIKNIRTVCATKMKWERGGQEG